MARPANSHKVYRSPDDVASRLAEAAEREAADTRTEAERWLGDPPSHRSALAARSSRAPQQRFIYDDPNIKPQHGEPFDSDFNAPKKKLSHWERYRQRRAVRF